MTRSTLILMLATAVVLAGCATPEEGDGPTPPTDGTPTTPTGPTSPTPNGTDGNGTAPPLTNGTRLSLNESFENETIAPWQTNFELPEDPNAEGNETVAWNITTSTNQSRSGNRSAAFAIDGRQDDGTIWVWRQFNVTPNQSYRVNLSAWAWSESESFNQIGSLVMYVGTTAPGAEADFDPDSETNMSTALRDALDVADEGWTQYNLTWDTPLLENGTLFVAVGVTIVWETEKVWYVDDVMLEIAPR
jgi:hypothetical protein